MHISIYISPLFLYAWCPTIELYYLTLKGLNDFCVCNFLHVTKVNNTRIEMHSPQIRTLDIIIS
jgi:hypothetical protein